MNAQEIRNAYLKFFEGRGHAMVKRAPLVLKDDPTTLFTGSGMQPMIPYLLGEPHPQGQRIVDSQTCLRAQDIDDIGDNRHTTFFEMLGNWSLGDYFKEQQIEWIAEFLFDVVGLDPNKVYVSCYIGNEKYGIPKDEEAIKLWTKIFEARGVEAKIVELGSAENGDKLGMQGGRIFLYDGKENWWSRNGNEENTPIGDPCGPDSEMFYDFGEPAHDPSFGEPHPASDSGRFMEIGNNVFMAYKKVAEGKFESGPTHWVLTLVCDDQPGIVHAITGAIVQADGNITESQQFSSHDTHQFFMRLQVESAASRTGFEAALMPVIDRYSMTWNLDIVGRPLRTLVLVSTAAHCLNDLMFRERAGQLPVHVPLVLSNHETLHNLANFYSVPFEAHPVTSGGQKLAFEDRILDAVEQHDIELVVLARYMQILSPELCDRLSGRMINIHHSFLPGFKGANPYRQAHARGVKLIGATAHFVTSDLDEGPIIEQNVVRVDHSRSPSELVAIGQDEESRTLTQAVKWFAENRVLLDGQRTIIFR